MQYPSYLDDPNPNLSHDSLAIGRRRVREYKNILLKQYSASMGYEVWINRVEGRGVDVKIKRNGIMDTVIELTNYSSSSYLSPKTKQTHCNAKQSV